ncbi:TetR/AcrR family transcriptional regulator [Ruminiclostridium cellobioparum]|jgi:AcrR family transcriptional regulator|uniref:TetR/AcrR family transcriptional regulator n=1 Tax=Ruminiclostridium cellobioparum TaxID=29355 RepID=UPI0028A7820C|nr:TetR/AcrR family transcriptional regulator [Ruminiclostridium cellobioparum]
MKRGAFMPRNKYPEETEQIILDAALKLFIENGYEQTTILDIVDEMGGLTRGAFYHHFKTKEEVFFALTDKLFNDIDPFTKIKVRTDINGLEKIKLTLQILNESKEYAVLHLQILPLIESSPIAFKIYMEKQRTFLASKYAELIEEGINDGSIKAKYPKLTAELFLLICNVWMMPTIYPQSNEEEAWQRFNMAKDIVDFLGLPVIDKALTSHVVINDQGIVVEIKK